MIYDQQTLKTCEENFAIAEATLRDIVIRFQQPEALSRNTEKVLRECSAICEEMLFLREKMTAAKSFVRANDQEVFKSEEKCSSRFFPKVETSQLQGIRAEIAAEAREHAESDLVHWIECWQDLVAEHIAEKTLVSIERASKEIEERRRAWECLRRSVMGRGAGWLSKIRTLRHANKTCEAQVVGQVQDQRIQLARTLLTRSTEGVTRLAGIASVFLKLSGHAESCGDKVIRRVLELEREEEVSRNLEARKVELRQHIAAARAEAERLSAAVRERVAEQRRAEAEKGRKMLQYYSGNGEDPSRRIARAIESQIGKTYEPLQDLIDKEVEEIGFRRHAQGKIRNEIERLMDVIQEYEYDARGEGLELPRATTRRTEQTFKVGEGTLRN
jgi:hypothetical protein